MPGPDDGKPRAYLGISGDEIFVQPAAEDRPVVCNGSPLQSSRWLRGGDVVELDDAELRVELDGDATYLRVRSRVVEAAAGDPAPAVEPPEIRLTPVRFEPSKLAAPRRSRRLPALATVAVWLLLAALAGGAWYVFTGEPLRIEVVPEPELLRLEGSSWAPRIGGRHLVRPGEYTVVAERPGYRRLEERLVVTGAANQSYRYELEPLPGRLSVSVEPADAGARVAIDGVDRGPAPLEGVELEAGEHRVSIVATGFQPFEEVVTIEGPGAAAELAAVLVDDRAPITFTSEPPGVAVAIGGARAGATPLTLPVVAGSHRIDWLRPGFKPARTRLEVEAGVGQTVAAPPLTPADGNLVLTSEPEGAAVTVDGVFAGRTPLELDLSPGVPHRLSLSKAGFDGAEREVTVAPGRSQAVAVELVEQRSELEVVTRPPGAEVWIDGELRGVTTERGLTVALGGADEHDVEVRKAGYLSHRVRVSPRPGLEQSLEVSLETPAEAQARRTPPTIRTADGQEMRLIPGGRFRMGAPRREPGRRPDEIERDVELTRPFYIATREVSNASFREFDPSHLSGRVGSVTLDLDDHPVVHVSWAAAARYCNWLSDKDSLPPAYVLRGGELTPVEPMNTGYRLPTEAEWEWVARYPEAPVARKYPWGPALPIPPLAGNFGDLAAAAILGRSLPGYDDKYPATSPVDSFAPNPLGIFNLGGNVAEWMSDRYAVDPRAGDPPERDPLGPASGDRYVIRGSSWTTATVTGLRLSARDAGAEGRPDVGFRIARYAETPQRSRADP